MSTRQPSYTCWLTTSHRCWGYMSWSDLGLVYKYGTITKKIQGHRVHRITRLCVLGHGYTFMHNDVYIDFRLHGQAIICISVCCTKCAHPWEAISIYIRTQYPIFVSLESLVNTIGFDCLFQQSKGKLRKLSISSNLLQSSEYFIFWCIYGAKLFHGLVLFL